MSSGRKKSKAPKIKAPPPITKTTFNLPTGDVFGSSVDGGEQVFTSTLSAGTQNLVNQSQAGLNTLGDELLAPNSDRIKAIKDRATDFYTIQAKGIDREADDFSKKLKSELADRFGGSLNSTFGADVLARAERDRQERLDTARLNSALYGEDLYRDDETSRLQRFGAFQNVLADINNQAMGLSAQGSQVLSSERQRATRVAIAQSNLDRAYLNDWFNQNLASKQFALNAASAGIKNTVGILNAG